MRLALIIVLTPLIQSCRGPNSYGGLECDSLQVPRRIGDLPIGSPGPAPATLFRSSLFIAADEDLKCCVPTYWTGPVQNPDSCAAIDCAALQASLGVAHLSGRFQDEPCGFDGRASCNVVLKGDMVVGVTAYCFDY
ncbi:MAG: hypothetical protein JNM17_02240 [Archangium sp.]|nr:hypothetical protein [Archangium sp.]